MTFDLDELNRAIDLIRGDAPPDPLNGANHLRYAPNMQDNARELAAAFQAPVLYQRRITLELDLAIPAGRIYAMCGVNLVLIITQDYVIRVPSTPALSWPDIFPFN